MPNTPDALRFIGLAAREGVGAVIAERDRPFADYSQGTPQVQPHPTQSSIPRAAEASVDMAAPPA